MANFTISFETFNESDARPTPIYRVTVTTGMFGSPQYSGGSIDEDLLLIERKSTLDGYIDEFYGIIKAADFQAFQKGSPAEGQTLYRAHAWNLVFYNLQVMQESIDLMKAQVKDLAEDAFILSQVENRRYDTFISPSF
jgi:hypothetical protein